MLLTNGDLWAFPYAKFCIVLKKIARHLNHAVHI